MTRNPGKKLKSEKAKNLKKLKGLQDDLKKISGDAHKQVKKVEQTYDDLRMQLYLKQNKIGQNLFASFWKDAFLKHPGLHGLLTDYDKRIFEYLKWIRVDSRVNLGYIILFGFWPNPFFENPWLAKGFKVNEDGRTTKGVGLIEIEWKERMADSDEVNSYEEAEGCKRVAPEKTFFSWFTTIEDIKENEGGDLVARLIKDDLWVNPFNYF